VDKDTVGLLVIHIGRKSGSIGLKDSKGSRMNGGEIELDLLLGECFGEPVFSNWET
jgi:hypothetical protein